MTTGNCKEKDQLLLRSLLIPAEKRASHRWRNLILSHVGAHPRDASGYFPGMRARGSLLPPLPPTPVFLPRFTYYDRSIEYTVAPLRCRAFAREHRDYNRYLSSAQNTAARTMHHRDAWPKWSNSHNRAPTPVHLRFQQGAGCIRSV